MIIAKATSDTIDPLKNQISNTYLPTKTQNHTSLMTNFKLLNKAPIESKSSARKEQLRQFSRINAEKPFGMKSTKKSKRSLDSKAHNLTNLGTFVRIANNNFHRKYRIESSESNFSQALHRETSDQRILKKRKRKETLGVGMPMKMMASDIKIHLTSCIKFDSIKITTKNRLVNTIKIKSNHLNRGKIHCLVVLLPLTKER